MSGRIVIDRLIAAGVKFEVEPSRAHNRNHGDLRDVFLVAEQRGRLSTMVEWKVEAETIGRGFYARGVEVALFDAPRALAKAPVFYASPSDEFSPYGVGLAISLTDPRVGDFPVRWVVEVR